MLKTAVDHATGPILSGLFSFAGSLPFLAAAADEDSVPLPVWFVTILLGGVLALVGWLLQRAVSKLDDQLTELGKQLRELDKEHAALRERQVIVEARCGVQHNIKKEK